MGLGKPTRSLNSTDFAPRLAIADAIISDMGNYQKTECLDMEHTLMDIDVTERGRLSMAYFYRPFQDGDRRVVRESPKYLDIIGALDAGTPRHDQVVFPNYVTSHGNSLRFSAFHRLCGVKKGGLLMTQLEAIVMKPDVRQEMDTIGPCSVQHGAASQFRSFAIGRCYTSTITLCT